MSKQLKDGGLQYVSRILTNKYNVSFSTLILIDATRNGNLMTVIAALYGIESSSGQSYQFLSDTVKHANKKATLPIFQITNMTRHDLIEMGISLANASGNLYNIKTCKKYETELVGTPATVKVVDIRGHKKGQRLWSQILSSCWS